MEQSCNTTVKSTTISNSWTVHKYSSIGSNVKLRSMVFTGAAHSRQPVSWYYQIEKQTNNNYSNGGCLVIEAFADSTYIPRFRIHGEIHLDCRSGNIYTCSGVLETDTKIGNSINVSSSTVNSFLLANDTLTLRFNCTLHEHHLNWTSKQGVDQQIPDAQLVIHLDDLLTKSTFSDVTLIAGKKQFLAHKAILAARSSVFAAMFNHEMQESKENVVNITDIKPEVFQEVLRFIYTGTVQKMDQFASELLIAAEMYALDNLKSKCGDHLGSTLSVETATATLALADKHNALALKQQAIQFISKHVKQLNPADWKEVLTNNFDVAAEIIAQMVKEK